MPDSKLSLHRKLAQVMYEAETIPKNGIGPREQGSYPFVRVGDAADHIRKALSEKVVTMMPTAVQVVGQSDRPTSKGGTMTTVDLIVDWTITDGESGETITLQTFGAGADTGDKYSGKAMTSAMKYAFLAGFLLSTGDDTENQDTSDRRSEPNLRVGAADHEAPASPDAGGAVEELLGVESAEGNVKMGTSEAYKLEPRETAEGMAFGFRLEMAGDKAIPQVVVMGEAAIAALLATQNDPKALLGHWVRVKGKLYAVRAPGRRSFNRLKATEIETREWSYPTPDVAAHTDSGGATSEEPDRSTPPAQPLTTEQEGELDAIPLFGDEPKAPAA